MNYTENDAHTHKTVRARKKTHSQERKIAHHAHAGEGEEEINNLHTRFK